MLVELPNALYAGFYWTLKNLQNQSKSDQQIAFLSTIAPSMAGRSPRVSLPQYAQAAGFEYQLDVLRREDGRNGTSSLTLRPGDIISDSQSQERFVREICRETTLDHGQAHALCENLCRGFAFTQGPPGTGKS